MYLHSVNTTRRALCWIGLTVVSVVPPVVLGPPAGAATGGVTGAGSGVFVPPPFTGDRVAIVLQAPGRFDVTHFDREGGEILHVKGKVTCSEVHGATAFVTGEIESGFALFGDPKGQTLAITIHDQGSTDLVGLAPPSRVLPPCAPIPLNTVIDQGDFRVARS
jgi:hypothetical protein